MQSVQSFSIVMHIISGLVKFMDYEWLMTHP